jgi:CBS domain-containing protein
MNMQFRRKEKRSSRWLSIAVISGLVASAAAAGAYLLFGRRRPQSLAPGAKRVDQAMTRDPRSVEPGAVVADVAQLMRTEDVGSVPVVQNGHLVGMVTDRDIAVRVVAEGKDVRATTVGEIGSQKPVTVAPEQELDDALSLMAQHQLRRIPVVDGDRLVGIVAQADIAREVDERQTGEVVQQVSTPA